MLAFSRFLRYFDAVARLGSIRRASEALNVSASAIDRQILRAELDFQTPLFERLPSGLRLTAAGELLMSAAGAWRSDYERVVTQMADLRGLRRGHVEIAVIDALSKGFVPDVVRQIRMEFPGISFTLKVLENVHVAQAITGGDVDFGLMLDPPTTRALIVRAHLEVRLGFVTLPEHPLSQRAAQRFSACTPYAVVAPSEPLALCRQFRALEAAAATPLHVVAASDNIEMIKSLVRQGVGVGILSALDAATEVRSGKLAFTSISDAMLKPLTLGLCQAPSRQLSSAANMALARIETYFSDQDRQRTPEPAAGL